MVEDIGGGREVKKEVSGTKQVSLQNQLKSAKNTKLTSKR